MTRLSTLPAVPGPGRRAVGRAVAGGLAALAVAPALADTAEAAAERKPRASASGTAARCTASTPAGARGRVGTGSTSRSPTCPTCPSAPDPDPDPDPPVAPVHTELPDAAALHLAGRFSYGMTPALHAEMQSFSSTAAWFARS